MRPVLCPVCGHAPVERINGDFTLTDRSTPEPSILSAEVIVAYRCRLRGHLFFVRLQDQT